LESATTAGRGPSFIGRLDRLTVLALAFLLGFGVLLPVVLGSFFGSLFLPSQDDPAYRRVALNLYATGRLEFNGWNSMTLIGEVFFAQPFLWLSRGAEWAFTAATATFAGVGIVAAFSVTRRVLSVSRATFCVLGVLVFPGFILNTTSYMTDVPTWAMAISCLALAAMALEATGGRRWVVLLAASLAVGCFGFSIREFAAGALAAVLVVAGLHGLGRRRGYWILVVLTVAACLAIFLYSRNLPGGSPYVRGPSLSLGGLHSAFNAVQRGVASLALGILPALVLAIAMWWRRWRLADVAIGIVVTSLFVAGPLYYFVRTGEWAQILAPNLISVYGSLDTGILQGGRPVLFDGPWWLLINLGAMAGTLVLGAVCGGSIGACLRAAWREHQSGMGGGLNALLGTWPGATWHLIWVYAVIYAAGITPWAMTVGVADRYVWPLLLPLYAILIKPPAVARVDEPSPERQAESAPGAGMRRRPWAASALSIVLLASLAATSFVLTVNLDAFSAAHWQMGETATDLGVPAGHVDAGWEWVSFYATGAADRRATDEPGTSYGSRWPSFRPCAVVSASSLSDPSLQLVEVDPQAYRLYGFAGPWEPLYLYRSNAAGCP
jgi:hypothetical protein